MTGVDEEPPQSSSPRMSHHPSSSSRTSPLPSSSPRTSHHRRRIHGSAPPRHRSSSPNPRPRKRRKEAAADPPAKVAGFTDGKAPSTSRTNLKHFEESARKLIQAAMHEYEGRIWTLDAYPSTEVQAVWVQEIWDGLNAEVQERTALTERIARMIKSYASHARSSLKDSIRPLIGPTYRFNAGETQKDMDKNVVLRGKLLKHSAFHYKDPGTLSIYAGHKIILASLRAAFFKKKGSRGVLYSKYFSPISLVTLALVFTVVEFCIDEYTTGRFMQAIFDEVAHKERYESHLLALTEWSELMPPVTTALRQQLHDRCRTLAGAAPVKAPQHLTDENRARALAELQAMQVDLGLEEERQEKEQEQEQEEEDGVRGDDTPVTPELELNDGNDA
ncbi:hypothetical protein FB45DRAFT_926588 [Roridomyces roridus]|uniref:DUF6532 domain-containing protein n=1 Tax=Roridomyces roridus TaxID=1738132 RepID=A0AAD7FH10_9AGAR|nr:hypothetical protein FB45DRAFT_926588 [Roridomyces roridus]